MRSVVRQPARAVAFSAILYRKAEVACCLVEPRSTGATTLLAIVDEQSSSGPARAVALAKAATRGQAVRLGLAWGDSPERGDHARPGEALLALARLHGVAPTAAEAAAVAELDSLPDPLGTALTRVIDAFLVFDGVTREASTATDLAAVLAARNALLDAVLQLDVALAAPEAALVATSASVALCPALALDLSGKNTTYSTDCALIVDVGGNDSYFNNAGGALAPLAAALIDLGAGADRYGDPARPRSHANGGAAGGILLFWAAGFLFDGGGDDQYAGASQGVNGGAEGNALGHLVDAGGNDTYTGGRSGVNGGGSLFGSGLLVDAAGSDTYKATNSGVNGGGFAGAGTLVDGGGNDVYTGGGLGVNGGAYAGTGLLLDGASNDAYTAGSPAVNGGATTGIGLLLDAAGTDTYADQDETGVTGPCSGTGTDRTLVPKCVVGGQVDLLSRAR